MCRLGINKVWPGDTGYPSRTTIALAFSSITRAGGSVQNAQGLRLFGVMPYIIDIVPGLIRTICKTKSNMASPQAHHLSLS